MTRFTGLNILPPDAARVEAERARWGDVGLFYQSPAGEQWWLDAGLWGGQSGPHQEARRLGEIEGGMGRGPGPQGTRGGAGSGAGKEEDLGRAPPFKKVIEGHGQPKVILSIQGNKNPSLTPAFLHLCLGLCAN